MALAAWDRCKCLLRPPSTSGYATKSPSSSPGEPGEGDWDNSWSGLFIPVGNTSLYGLQDAVGSLGTKRASNVKAPFEEEIVLLEPHAWTLEGMAQWSDMKALSLQMGTRLCILCLARKAARGHLK
ncbi:PREDICTED: uncharacterized protein LOC107603728 isoform X2 [Ficedula albicollis]|uniref:uncharacterized protein LOC107603728 isoform X2 n=1 Tax=Ficedula albicollis TaxID=59894 RepID=UPI0007AD94ED|nr:PREDICTED: uncharacterized protein LOC107603728 isoform X2 [Ficedula albicollis]